MDYVLVFPRPVHAIPDGRDLSANNRSNHDEPNLQGRPLEHEMMRHFQHEICPPQHGWRTLVLETAPWLDHSNEMRDVYGQTAKL